MESPGKGTGQWALGSGSQPAPAPGATLASPQGGSGTVGSHLQASVRGGFLLWGGCVGGQWWQESRPEELTVV